MINASKLLRFVLKKGVLAYTPNFIIKTLQSMENSRRYTLRKQYFPLLKAGISEDASIFCNNCFGARISQDLGYQYNLPIAGLKFPQDDYHLLLENIEYIRNSEIKPRQTSKYEWFSEEGYPIGYIDLNGNDIEVWLVHYRSIAEANQKWQRRCQRINFNNLIILETDYANKTTEVDVNRFFSLPFEKKIYFSSNPSLNIEYKNFFLVEECQGIALAPYQEAHILYKYLVKADWFTH